jgi:PQQ-like domain
VTAGFEFEASLRQQLRKAAEREQLRGRLARLVAAGRALLSAVGHSALPATAAAATVAAAVAVAAIFLMSGSEQRPVAPPEVVAEFSAADTLGATIAAHGSVWMNDTSREELLRIDPQSRRVTARLPVNGEVTLGAGAGALWVLQEGSRRGGYELHGPLLRIDPATNRVTARIALRATNGQPFAGAEVLADRDQVWVSGPTGALRIDPQTNRVTKAVAAPDELISTDFALSAGGLWAITETGLLLGFDPTAGTRLSEVRVALTEPLDVSGGQGDALFATLPGAMARVDPYTGRVLWRTRLGQRVHAWVAARGLIWARSSGQVHDRLSGLDPDTGRVLTRVELDDFGGSGVEAINDELWLSTVGGNVVVLRR